MMYENQGEFFEEFKELDPPLKQLAKKVLPKKRPHIIQMPLEGMIIAVILMLLACIIIFAIGVEAGKSQGASAKREGPQGFEKAGPDVTDEVLTEKTAQGEQPKVETVTDTKEGGRDTLKPYTIQLISYKDEKRAKAKAYELKKMGSEAFLIQNKEWYQVCAGSYRNQKEANADLEKFGATYKGCFLREKVNY